MITIHCLAYSRAIRLLWLMEDLNQPYDLVLYDRTDNFRAPASLAKVHPLGKSPVMEEGELMLAESATCLRYLADRFGKGGYSHCPAKESIEHLQHEELLDYVESSFAEVAMNLLLPKLNGQEPSAQAFEAMQKHYDYVAEKLGSNSFLFGENLTLADIQFSYLLANLANMGMLDSAPRLIAYWEELQRQPGYQAAIANAGPMAPELQVSSP